MNIEHEFDWSHDAADAEFENSSQPSSLGPVDPELVISYQGVSAPLVVVHYRTRWSSIAVLFTSMLILATSVVLTSTRVGLFRESGRSRLTESDLPKGTTLAIQTPQYLRTERFEAEHGAPSEPNLRVVARSQVDDRVGVSLKFSLPVVEPIPHIGALPEDHPRVPKRAGAGNARLIAAELLDPADVWTDIEREADARQQAQAESLKLKGDRPDQLRKEAARQFVDLKRQSDATRVAFRQALRGVMDRSGARAGQEVRRLVETMHQEVPTDVLAQAKYLKENSAARLPRSEQLDLFRAIGLPETSLLYHLVEVETSKQRQRGGPRTMDDAWARAAKVLVDSPPGPKSQTVPPLARLYFTPNGPGRDASRLPR